MVGARRASTRRPCTVACESVMDQAAPMPVLAPARQPGQGIHDERSAVGGTAPSVTTSPAYADAEADQPRRRPPSKRALGPPPARGGRGGVNGLLCGGHALVRALILLPFRALS